MKISSCILVLAIGLVVANAAKAEKFHSECLPEITSQGLGGQIPDGPPSLIIMGNCLNKITQVVLANSDGSGSGFKALEYTTTQNPNFKTDLLVTMPYLEDSTNGLQPPLIDRKLKIQTCNRRKTQCDDSDYIWVKLKKYLRPCDPTQEECFAPPQGIRDLI